MGNAASIGKEARAALSKVLSEVMLSARNAVTNATPVDTGNAANNWVLSVGRPFTGLSGSRESPSSAAQDAGDERIRDYDIGKDGPIYLRNNVLYLQFLDEGHSQQAPAGFVAAALQTAVRLAPRGRKQAVRRMLKGMSKHAFKKGF